MVVVLVVTVVAWVFVGIRRWHATTAAFIARLDAANARGRQPSSPPDELGSLPAREAHP